LPSYFGGNWDALAIVRATSLVKGAGYVYARWLGQKSSAESAPEDFQTALGVFAEAADFWKGKGTPFVVSWTGQELPAF
jgi:hypothetical protein